MPLGYRRIKGKWRVVEPSGSIAKNAAGTALDGGGHESATKARKQAQAANISQARQRGTNIPKRNALA